MWIWWWGKCWSWSQNLAQGNGCFVLFGWERLCLSIHLPSSIQPNHHPIAITIRSNAVVLSVRPAAAASSQVGPAREGGCMQNIFCGDTESALAMNFVIFRDSLKDCAFSSCDTAWKLGFYSNGEKMFPAFMAANKILTTVTASTSKTQNLDCKCKVRVLNFLFALPYLLKEKIMALRR